MKGVSPLLIAIAIALYLAIAVIYIWPPSWLAKLAG